MEIPGLALGDQGREDLAHVLIHAVTIGTRGDAVPVTQGEPQYRRSGEKPGDHFQRAVLYPG
jgi:hypothetical protein